MVGPLTEHFFGGGTQMEFGHIDTTDPAKVKLLEDDAYFMHAVDRELNMSGLHVSNPTAAKQVLEALTGTDLSALSPAERAEVIRSVQMSRAGFSSHPNTDAATLIKTIERLANNQGYTGPGSEQVLVTVPKAGGGGLNVTRGEVLDNEGFAGLVDNVFVAAGGHIMRFGNFGAFGDSSAPGQFIDGRLGRADMSKWSEEERVSFLKLVADCGRDGSMTGSEVDALNRGIQQRNQGGGDEASLTLANGVKVGFDDITEDSTFRKQLSSLVNPPFGIWPGLGTAATELSNLIASADCAELSFEERSSLLLALGEARKDGMLSNAEASKILQMMKAGLTPSSARNGESGTTLSNGLFVSQESVAGDNGFGALIQQTLQRSGIPGPAAPSMHAAGLGNAYSVPQLLMLDVSRLSPDQRVAVLEMIAKASADRVIDTKELYAIRREVNRMSGGQALFF
jgi:hypothetical protein